MTLLTWGEGGWGGGSDASWGEETWDNTFAQRGRQRCELDTRHGRVSISPGSLRLCQVNQRAGVVGFCASVSTHRRSLWKSQEHTARFGSAPAPSPPLLSAVGGEGRGYEGVLPAGLNSTFWDFGGKGSKGDASARVLAWNSENHCAARQQGR